jgi:hypothetical protein
MGRARRRKATPWTAYYSTVLGTYRGSAVFSGNVRVEHRGAPVYVRDLNEVEATARTAEEYARLEREREAYGFTSPMLAFNHAYVGDAWKHAKAIREELCAGRMKAVDVVVRMPGHFGVDVDDTLAVKADVFDDARAFFEARVIWVRRQGGMLLVGTKPFKRIPMSAVRPR